MPLLYSNNEYLDMLSIFYENKKNSLNASRMYLEKYPDRRQPSRTTFVNVERILRLTDK